jgi:hypothetical protein
MLLAARPTWAAIFKYSVVIGELCHVLKYATDESGHMLLTVCNFSSILVGLF